MTLRVLLLAALLAALTPGASAAADAPRLVLPTEVEVRGARVRLADLSTEPLDPALGAQELCAAPAPGHALRLSQAAVRRRLVQTGVRPVPHVAGARAIVIRRSGTEISSQWLRRELVRRLARAPLPDRALAQEWTVSRVPELRGTDATPELLLDDLGPLVGRGSLRFTTVDSDGQRRRHFASVRRRLRTTALRLQGPAERGTDLAVAPVRVDTLWVDDPGDWDRLHRPQDGRAGWSLRRTRAAGAWLDRHDLEPTPLVFRGQRVEWQVREGELAVTLAVESRGEGALGDWILVQSPFDDRLKRVCVIGPARVSQHPPSTLSDGASSPTTPADRGDHP